jgi:hypothetical protein
MTRQGVCDPITLQPCYIASYGRAQFLKLINILDTFYAQMPYIKGKAELLEIIIDNGNSMKHTKKATATDKNNL